MKLLFLLFLTPTSVWLHLESEPRIIGGETAHSAEFKYAAAITVQTNTSRFFCGGTLLSQEWILTAGQCVNGATQFTIQLGSNKLEGDDPNRVTVATSEYVIHPDFNANTLENDVGLIKLRMPVEYSFYLNRISFLASSDVEDGGSLLVIGWGQTSDNSSDYSNDLLKARVVSLSNEECKTVYGNSVNANTVCVEGNYNEGSCYGDTGGALLMEIDRGYKVHMGIASFLSSNGCESTDPSGYIRTYPYVDWIQNVTSV